MTNTAKLLENYMAYLHNTVPKSKLEKNSFINLFGIIFSSQVRLRTTTYLRQVSSALRIIYRTVPPNDKAYQRKFFFPELLFFISFFFSSICLTNENLRAFLSFSISCNQTIFLIYIIIVIALKES